ncbi:MAG TPA: cache domain-containing protein, partial [Phycisphaeraceae bacterium]
MVDPRLLKPLVGSTFVGKILIGILPVVLVSLGAVTGAHYIVARDQISKDIRHEIQMLADQVAIHVRSFVEQRLRDLDTVVENPLLADYYKNVNYGLLLEAAEYRKQLYGYLQTFSNRTQVYSLLLYLDAQGRMVAGVREGQVITDPDAWIPPIGDIRRSGVYRSPVLDTPQGDKQMVLAKAVFDEGGEYQGAIVLMCDLRHLESQVLNRTRLGV